MGWMTKSLGSSVGKKLMMAVTGLGFCLFLAGHLAGNLSIYGGRSAFNSYAEHLHALGPLLKVMELGLLFFACIHILTAATLYWENLRARPVRYAVNKRGGGRTLGSATMPYTGLILLIFVIIHLLNFHFVDKTGTTIYQIVTATFRHPGYVLFYVAAMVLVAIHISHGLWSAFQTLGANHPKYMPWIRGIGIAFSIIVGIGFGLIPVYLQLVA